MLVYVTCIWQINTKGFFCFVLFFVFWLGSFIGWRTIWSLKIWWIPRLITIHDLHTNSIHSQMAHFRPWRIEKLVIEICLVGHFFYPGTNDLEIDLFLQSILLYNATFPEVLSIEQNGSQTFPRSWWYCKK